MSRRNADAARAERHHPQPRSGVLDLRYVARAGLIPELSGQTYDALWKALREAVLNSVDASATGVHVGFRDGPDGRELLVEDDGVGMSFADLAEHFVSVGGSVRFGDDEKFGRIGIGSLALLQYGSGMYVETKRAGSSHYVVAHLTRPTGMDQSTRRLHLDRLDAGTAEEVVYQGPSSDSFTRLRLVDLRGEAAAAASDPTQYFSLVEILRRVLPLAWPTNRFAAALSAAHPRVASEIAAHSRRWSASVTTSSEWSGRETLTRRHYGEREGLGEDWAGRLRPIAKTIAVADGVQRREVRVLGFLLNQRHAATEWSGLTARVQNVAVERRTFFDVTADPGFRKYMAGEVFITGDLDRARLINIDRASFNRESPDYQAVQRFMATEIQTFKTEAIQRPQRAKVALRRQVLGELEAIEALRRCASTADVLLDGSALGVPSSSLSARGWRRTTVVDRITRPNVVVTVTDSRQPEVRVGESGKLECAVPAALFSPEISLGGKTYPVAFCRAGEGQPALILRNRPRELLLNMDHAVHTRKGPAGYSLTLAMELAYLLGGADDSDRLMTMLHAFLAA